MGRPPNRPPKRPNCARQTRPSIAQTRHACPKVPTGHSRSPTWPSSLNKDRYKKYTTIIRTRNKREEKEARQSVTTRSSPGLLPPLIGRATVHGWWQDHTARPPAAGLRNKYYRFRTALRTTLVLSSKLIRLFLLTPALPKGEARRRTNTTKIIAT